RPPSTLPTAVTCCRRAAWCWRGGARSCGAATSCAGRTWGCSSAGQVGLDHGDLAAALRAQAGLRAKARGGLKPVHHHADLTGGQAEGPGQAVGAERAGMRREVRLDRAAGELHVRTPSRWEELFCPDLAAQIRASSMPRAIAAIHARGVDRRRPPSNAPDGLTVKR